DWHIVLLRIHDFAIGCAVSELVGLFFWPRGATAADERAGRPPHDPPPPLDPGRSRTRSSPATLV
ncbi:hypothetical protein ACFV8Z_35190, partial [Streptomyces sp. NPDC059837]|uniref:hypothetical protein n=1 Tax=Streptomyces sp. NPDC059837 TaxID=3346968 RepID=UPI0036521B05